MSYQPVSKTCRAPAELVLFCTFLISSCGGESGIPPLEPPSYVAVDTQPAWSADNSVIAFGRYFPSSAGPPGIYLIRADGTGCRFLLAAPASCWRFSPDDSRLSMTMGTDVFLFTFATGKLERITKTDEHESDPDWSPDGRSLVVSSALVADGGLRIINLDTGLVTPIIHQGNRVYALDPRWSPSGESIVFASAPDIATITPDGSTLRRVVDGAARHGYASHPIWLYGGTHILYDWHSRGADQSRIVRADGTGDVPWPVRVHVTDSISPDSRHFATIGIQPGDEQLFDLPVAVLFVQELDDVSGHSSRQLTSYSPPPGLHADQ